MHEVDIDRVAGGWRQTGALVGGESGERLLPCDARQPGGVANFYFPWAVVDLG